MDQSMGIKLASTLLSAIIFAIVLAHTAIAGSHEDAMAAYERQDYATAMRLLRPLAEQGSADAQDVVGVMYAEGQGVPRDYVEAANWYRRSAEQGLAWAQYNLGRFYEDGHGVPQDYVEAAKWFRRSAEQGLAWAQYELGRSYAAGRGVPKDYANALKWYRSAAEQGNSAAQNNLGVMYGEGLGVPQNHAKALEWYRKAAEQGNIFAQNNLGRYYAAGIGVPQDYVQAHAWFNLAASVGQHDAGWQKEVRDALKSRNIVAAKMTPAQIDAAQRTAMRLMRPVTEQSDAHAQAAATPEPSKTPEASALSEKMLHAADDPVWRASFAAALHRYCESVLAHVPRNTPQEDRWVDDEWRALLDKNIDGDSWEQRMARVENSVENARKSMISSLSECSSMAKQLNGPKARSAAAEALLWVNLSRIFWSGPLIWRYADNVGLVSQDGCRRLDAAANAADVLKALPHVHDKHNLCNWSTVQYSIINHAVVPLLEAQ
jgi:TPR repeat protein